MTNAQKRLRDLKNRQSTERGKMAELSLVDELTDEQRGELDTIERGTADLERQIRAATIAVETEESEQRTAGPAGGRWRDPRARRAAQQGQSAGVPRNGGREPRSRRRRGRIPRGARHSAQGPKWRVQLPARIARAARTTRGGPRHHGHGHHHHAATLARPAVRRHGRRERGHHDGIGPGGRFLASRHHGGRERSATPALGEIRVEGRKLSGTVLRYGEVSPSHRERFEPGALRMAAAVHLDLYHDRERVIAYLPGGGLELSEADGALELAAELPPIPAADRALEEIRTGTTTGLSVEFRCIEDRREGGIRIISAAELRGVGLVKAPSYHGSRVELRHRRWRAWL